MRLHYKHVLMCTGPRCTENGQQAEAMFKQLGQAIDACDGLKVKRTRSHCFAVCKEGPIMVVYPEGVWYLQGGCQRSTAHRQRAPARRRAGRTPDFPSLGRAMSARKARNDA
jgi:hypothetical protein